jgi:O-succinylbenzoic acid--CoA ligase
VVVDVLARSPGRPDAVALATPAVAWTFAQLADMVDARARQMRGEGLRPGFLHPVVLETGAEGIVTLLAAWRTGAIPAPLHPRLTERERDVALSSLHGVPEGTQVVLWTSGTGGRARGVALSFANLAASAQAAAERLSLGPHDVWLASLSLAHVGGLALVTRSLLFGGAVVVIGSYDVRIVAELLGGRESSADPFPAITHLALVPTQLLDLLDELRGRPPAQLRCALIGGAHAPADLVARAHRAGWPLALTYGATEMSSQIATADPELTRRKPGTVGRALPGLELRLLGDGEVLAKGPTQAIGYVGHDVEPLADRDGWYRTGDVGRLDSDGDLWITGRRADRIVSGGVTVDAIEVEEAVRTHPSVIDVCVVGLPDDRWGEKVAAWIEPVVGEFDVERIESHLAATLSAPKLPRLWHVGGELPRNAIGKLDRLKVRETLAEK